MKTYRQTSWHTWIAMGDVMLAGLFGLFMFVLLNVVSLGLLVTLATVGILFLVFGLALFRLGSSDDRAHDAFGSVRR